MCSWVCESGRGDCDGLALNGCEAKLANNGLNCGACGVQCAPCVMGECQDPLAPPKPCVAGEFGVISGDPWVVCSADETKAWISANYEGTYDASDICQSLGYLWVSQWGGTCGNVCGVCEAFTQCWQPGAMSFLGGIGWCDKQQGILCGTVTWECSNSPPP